MKLCMMSYTMGRQGVSPEDIVRCAVEVRLEGIDWVTTHDRPASELKAMSDDAGLTVVAHTFLLWGMVKDGDWRTEARQSLEDAVALGAPIVMIPTLHHPTLPRDEFRLLWIDALEEIAGWARDAGLVLTVENFPGVASAFVTSNDFREAQRRIPDLKLTFDNGNAAGGEDPVASFKACAEDVVHIHLKDWTVGDGPGENLYPMLDGRYFKPALIGEGVMPTAACWNAFREYGYTGFINIEYEGDDIPAAEAVARAAAYLRSL